MSSPSWRKRLVRTGLSTAVIDGCFATVLHVTVFGSTFTRLWQEAASVPLGPRALEGGWATVGLGLLLHVVVAFVWSAVFLFLVLRWPWVRRRVASTRGMLEVAAIYGPLIWLVMSMLVIPLFTHRPPRVNGRWWIQLVGHIPFVAVPIVVSSTRAPRRDGTIPESPSAGGVDRG
jgi:hypothetical protein